MLWSRIARCYWLLHLMLLIMLPSSIEKKIIESEVVPERVQHLKTSNATIKLRCTMQNQTNEVIWEHKNCGYALNLTLCHRVGHMKWIPVMCKNGSKPCEGRTLKLGKSEEKKSGLYRCSYKNYMSTTYDVSNIFQLEVKDLSAPTTEILKEHPSIDNKTVFVNGSALFRCRARSIKVFSIVWAKQVNNITEGAHVYFKMSQHLSYQNQTFELLNASRPYRTSDQMYTTKLKLTNCQPEDSGLYYCIVITPTDMHSKVVALNVLPIPSISGEDDYPWWLPLTVGLVLTVIASVVCCILLAAFRSRKQISYHSSR